MKTVNYKKLITLIAILVTSIYITGCAGGRGYRGGYGYGSGIQVGTGTATGVAAGAALGAITSRNGWEGAAKGGLIGGAAGAAVDLLTGQNPISTDNGYYDNRYPQPGYYPNRTYVEPQSGYYPNRTYVEPQSGYYQDDRYRYEQPQNQVIIREKVIVVPGNNRHQDNGYYQDNRYYQPTPRRYCDPCRR